MLLTRPAFWYLPKPRFARCLGGFAPYVGPRFGWRFFLGLRAHNAAHSETLSNTRRIGERKGRLAGFISLPVLALPCSSHSWRGLASVFSPCSR